MDNFYSRILNDQLDHLREVKTRYDSMIGFREKQLNELKKVLSEQDLQILESWTNSNRACFQEGQVELRNALAEFYGADFNELPSALQVKWCIMVNSAFFLSSIWCQVASYECQIQDAEERVAEYQQKVNVKPQFPGG